MSQLVENISDTARWVAIFRAEESERADAVFHDPFARKLAGEKGAQIANAIKFGRDNSWSFVARTYHFDQFIMEHVKQGYDMIVNLAAGLDARAYRMQLPKTLKWVDVDLPRMISYKKEVLKTEKPVCEYKTVAIDLADKKARLKLFQQLNRECNKALVVTEGLIIYLTDEQAADLASELSSQNHFRRWIFDLASPALLEMIKKEMQHALQGSGAIFQFAPENGESFFEKYGWKPIESRSKLKTAAKLNRLSDEIKTFAEMPEPPGPYRPFPWSGDCLLENTNSD